jgi:7-cyano-7-deazaguanine synthase in queuosine biosynthesis
MNEVQVKALNQALSLLEDKLEQLSAPLLSLDHDRIVACSADFQQALVQSVSVFRQLKETPQTPKDLVRRVRRAKGRVQALREALSRMTAAMDRALEVLIPKHAVATYGRYQSAPVGPSGRFTSLSA